MPFNPDALAHQPHHQEWETFRDGEVALYAQKELGPYYDVALSHFHGNVHKLHGAIGIQLKRHPELRDADGYLHLKLVNLHDLGLSDQQIETLERVRAREDRIHLAHEANMHAAKELGPYLPEAIARMGGMKEVVAEARSQLDDLKANHIPLRDGSKIKTGLLVLTRFISDKSAAERDAQLQAENTPAPVAAVAEPIVEATKKPILGKLTGLLHRQEATRSSKAVTQL